MVACQHADNGRRGAFCAQRASDFQRRAASGWHRDDTDCVQDLAHARRHAQRRDRV